jgi:cation diffusion facilitator family transporter
MADCDCEIEVTDSEQKNVLYWLLSINFVMFLFEAGFGWYAQSTALIADSVDMLADAVVYGISVYAVGRTPRHKSNAALFSGYFQGCLGIMIFGDVIRRVVFGHDPMSYFMMGVGAVALAANVVCLLLIQKHRHGEVHMRASWIFSTNDVIANCGVILGGGIVLATGTRWPDVIIATIIALVILRGARKIIVDAKTSMTSDVNESHAG